MRRKSTLLIRMVALPLFLAVLSSCNSPRTSSELPTIDVGSNYDDSLITVDPCAPPCWQGIVPYESTRQQAMSSLTELSFVDADTIESQPFSGGEQIFWGSLSTSSDEHIGAIAVNTDGQVESIFTAVEYQLEIQQLVGVYGEPDIAYVRPWPPDIAPPDYSIELYWFEYGLVSYSEIEKGQSVEGNLLVSGVTYLMPVSTLQEFLEVFPNRFEQEFIQDWQGFDSIKVP